MPQQNLPSFRNSLKLTKYPFIDTVDLNLNDRYFIPESLFEDASIYITDDILKLMRIRKEGSFVHFYFGTVLNPEIATGVLDIYNGTGILEFYTDASFAGILVYDPVAALMLSAWEDGTYSFITGLELCLSCYVNMSSVGVSGFKLEDGTLSVGNVCLVGTDGVILEKDGNVITVNYVGDPLYKRRSQGEYFVTPRFVTNIIFQVGRLDSQAQVKSVPTIPDENGLINIGVINVGTVGLIEVDGIGLINTNLSGDVLRIYSGGTELNIEIIGGSR